MSENKFPEVYLNLEEIEKYIYSDTIDTVHLKEKEQALLTLLDEYRNEYLPTEDMNRYSFNNAVEYALQLCLGDRMKGVTWTDFPVSRIYYNLQYIADMLSDEAKAIEYAHQAYNYNPQDLRPLLSMTHIFFRKKQFTRFKAELFQIADLIYSPVFFGKFLARLSLYYNAQNDRSTEYACLHEANYFCPNDDYKARIEELAEESILIMSRKDNIDALQRYNIPCSISKYKIERLKEVLEMIKTRFSDLEHVARAISDMIYIYTNDERYSPYKTVSLDSCGAKFDIPHDWFNTDEENDFINKTKEYIALKRPSGLSIYVNNKGLLYNDLKSQSQKDNLALINKGYKLINEEMLNVNLDRFETAGLFQYIQSENQKFVATYLNINGYRIQIVFELDPSIEMRNNNKFKSQPSLEDFFTFIHKLKIDYPKDSQQIDIKMGEKTHLYLNLNHKFGEIKTNENRIEVSDKFKIYIVDCENLVEMESIANKWLDKNFRVDRTILDEKTEFKKVNGKDMIEKTIETDKYTKLYRFVFVEGKMLIFSLFYKNTNTNKYVLNTIANIHWGME